MIKKFNPLTGLVEDFPEDGSMGPQGPVGPKGDRGEKGDTGPVGPRGEAGEPGNDGLDGKPGRDGVDGKDGINGKDGKDGLDGKNGKTGKASVIHSTVRIPTDDLGKDGDWCITAFTELFYKEKGKWVFKNLLRGMSAPGIKKAVSLSFNTSSTRNTLVGDNLQDVMDRLFEESESQAPVIAANGTITSITYYNSSSQITANRTGISSLTYNADLEPTEESLTLYDTDGTTILKIITKTYTWAANVLTKVETATV